MSAELQANLKDVDVLVAGAGVAGLMAAVTAAHAGARVRVVEKQPVSGGSSYISGGFFAFAGTEEQAALGISDSSAQLEADLLTVGGGLSDPALVRQFAYNQFVTYEFLKLLGTHFQPPVLSSGQSVPRSHQVYVPSLIGTLEKELAASGGKLVWNTSLRELTVGSSGLVAGLAVKGGDEIVRVRPNKATILATGGFSRNREMIERFASGKGRALLIGGNGNSGDGIALAESAGAVLRDMDQIKGTFGCHPDYSGDSSEILLSNYSGAIIVNKEGRRFVNESLSYKLLGDACLEQPDCLGYEIFDRKVMDRSQPGTEMFDFDDVARRGLLVTAGSLEELAGRIGIPPENLIGEIDGYNARIRAGEPDPLGRRSLSMGYGEPLPIDEPPFRAFKATAGIVATYCGVTVDRFARLLDAEGLPIDHLYAIGEIIGGFHGRAYMTGTSLGKSAVFGRIAGMHACGGA